MNRLLFALTLPFVAIAIPAAAQNVEGYWEGTLDAGTVQLPIGITIERGEDGALTGTLDSPQQGAFDIPLGETVNEGGALTITVPAIAGRYEAEWDGENRQWIGTWRQGGGELPLVLRAAERPDRAQAKAEVPPPLPAEWSFPAKESIANILQDRIAQRPGAGIVVATIDGGSSDIVAAGAGFDGDTVFEIGSMTKVFTSLLLAQMVLDGTVSLDDPVALYLPDGAMMPKRGKRQITLRNLSHHDSGLPRLPDNLAPADMANPYVDYGEAELLEFLANYELPRDIGSEVEYSNLGAGLLGYALARAEGTDFATLLQHRVLDPLGMGDTGIALDADMEGRFAVPLDGYLRPTSAWDLAVLSGAGGMRSTAADIAKFLAASLDSGSPIAEAIRLMASETRPAPDYTAGLGWGLRSTPMGPIAAHGGGTGGFRSHMAVQPATGRAVVVLTNTALEPAARDISLHLLIGSELEEAGSVPTIPEQIARDTVALTSQQLDRVVGTYRFAPGLDMFITRQDDGLQAALTGQGALPIYPSAPLAFFWRTVNANIEFLEDDGKITGATFTQDGNVSELVRVN